MDKYVIVSHNIRENTLSHSTVWAHNPDEALYKKDYGCDDIKVIGVFHNIEVHILAKFLVAYSIKIGIGNMKPGGGL